MTTGQPITLDHVHLTLEGRSILVNITTVLQQSGRMVILGANGAGKTALLRILHGLQKPSLGTIEWGGQKTVATGKQAYVPAGAIPFRRSVQENILLALRLKNITGNAALHSAKQALELCQIEHLAEQPARTLSSGETQKLFLARAWALGAETLLLDEPTANLDPASTASIEGLINDLHHKGVAIFVVTHQIAQARRLADRVLFLDQGQLCEVTEAETFFTQPKTQAAKAYLAEQ